MLEVHPRKTGRYGWVPDLPDQRDLPFAAVRPTGAKFPSKIDLTAGFPDPYDQGRIGSCTANAIAAAIQFDLRKQGLPDVQPSRLFIYWNEREVEGSTGYDSGAMLRDGIKSVAKFGVCPETEWPYDDTPPAYDGGPWPDGSRAGWKPGTQQYDLADDTRAASYRRVYRTLEQMRGCLASGFPFVFGFTVYDSFESDLVAQTGIAPMPSRWERPLGGHAVLAVGYDDTEQRFLVRNSWGSGWGLRGYFTLPYDYLTDRSLSSDFWTIRVVT